MYCRNCGKEVAENAEVCVNCGVKPLVSKKFCQNCGAETQPNQEICTSCGVKLLNSKTTAGSGGSKSKMAAGLLAIFLGTLGIHKFYLGYSGPGIILLLVSILGGIITLGIIPLVIWLITIIEGIIYLTKSDEDFEEIYVKNEKKWF